MDWVQVWYALLAGLFGIAVAGVIAMALAMLYMFTLTAYIKWQNKKREPAVVVFRQKKKNKHKILVKLA